RRGADRPTDRRPGLPQWSPRARTGTYRSVSGRRLHGANPGRGGVPPLDVDWRGRGRPGGVIKMSQAIRTVQPGHYRLKDVVRSEVAKIATLPSTAITLGLTVVAG